jgi:hypothetical protein
LVRIGAEWIGGERPEGYIVLLLANRFALSSSRSMLA